MAAPAGWWASSRTMQRPAGRTRSRRT
jgi:hypothetical protein